MQDLLAAATKQVLKNDIDTLVRQWVRSACIACNRPELFDEIEISWSNRMTSCMGVAKFKRRGDQAYNFRIVFSTLLYERASFEEQKETAFHEACHIIDADNRGTSAHDWQWRSLMRQCGYPNAARCHKVDNSDLKSKRKVQYFDVKCSCSTHQVAMVRLRRMRQGKRYICTKCRGKIEECQN